MLKTKFPLIISLGCLILISSVEYANPTRNNLIPNSYFLLQKKICTELQVLIVIAFVMCIPAICSFCIIKLFGLYIHESRRNSRICHIESTINFIMSFLLTFTSMTTLIFIVKQLFVNPYKFFLFTAIPGKNDLLDLISTYLKIHSLCIYCIIYLIILTAIEFLEMEKITKIVDIETIVSDKKYLHGGLGAASIGILLILTYMSIITWGMYKYLGSFLYMSLLFFYSMIVTIIPAVCFYCFYKINTRIYDST
ncbi:hypothetical protein SLOPH_515, partial [Spraguea lophii 42_110]